MEPLLNFGIFWEACLLVFGCLWIRHMAARWRSDVADFRAAREAAERLAIGGLWALTGVIVYVLGSSVVGVVARIAGA